MPKNSACFWHKENPDVAWRCGSSNRRDGSGLGSKPDAAAKSSRRDRNPIPACHMTS